MDQTARRLYCLRAVLRFYCYKFVIEARLFDFALYFLAPNLPHFGGDINFTSKAT